MASNSIKIFDDTVIKLTIKQGLEEQRSNEVLGTFNNGELAYTRDTGRLFVGDNSDGEPGHIGLQETVGGSLVGNKYLGLIDSKPLVINANNGEPLSFEVPTSSTGTQELGEFVEPGLLTEQSKFRLHSADGASTAWHNWDRTAVYNPKYNAYNGDFMYDVYQNALILFDTRISGDPEAASQPQIKKDAEGNPVEPETFIVDGEEISSEDERALSLTRRSILQNYSKTNKDTTNSELVYGDGYVVLRMVEPDNQTIRFKPRGFQRNGNPNEENNYTHNLLEVYHVPTSAMSGNFTDDFVITSGADPKISLNKKISQVESITGKNGEIKIPKNLSFSTSNGGRDATTFMRWVMNEPQGITVPTSQAYKLVLKPETDKKTDNGKEYLCFNASLEADKPWRYTINLEGGLESDQSNPNTLVIDEQAVSDDISSCPTLKIARIDKETTIFDGDNDPYLSEQGTDLYYSGNLAVDYSGTVMNIDEFSDSYYLNVQKKVDKWTEQNTSVNYLKTPVTILQSSTSANLYKEGEEKYTTNTYQLPSTSQATSPTTSTTAIGGDFTKLAKLATTHSSFHTAPNTGSSSPSGVTWDGNALNIANLGTSGVAAIVAGPNLPDKTYLKNVSVAGQVSNLSGTGTVRIFLALIHAGNIIKVQERSSDYKPFSFGFDFNLDEVIMKGTEVFLAFGFIFDSANGDTSSNVKVTLKTISSQTRTLSDEEIFTLSDAGVNVNVDFNVSPYVFCTKKTVSTPNNFVLPKIESVTQYPSNLESNYFTNFNATNNKTWNNLVSVLGHNHYKNWADKTSTIPMGRGGESTLKKAAFLGVNSFDVEVSDDGTVTGIKKHTGTLSSELEEDETDFMVFSWYEEYTKTGNTKENHIFYPLDEFDTRSSEIISEYGKNINFVRLQGNNNNIISNQSGGVLVSAEQEIQGEGSNRYRRQYAIYWDSSLITANIEGIEYGIETPSSSSDVQVEGDPITNFYSFKKHKGYGLFYDIFTNEDTIEVVFVKEGGDNVAFEREVNVDESSGTITIGEWKDPFKTAFPNGRITVDSNVPSDGDVSDFDYVVLVSTDTEPEIVTSPDEVEDEEVEGTTDSYEVYKIQKSVPYLTGYFEPKKLTSVPIVTTDGATSTTSVTLDETLDEEDKVYIPTNARNIILELTHITTENNTIGVMYANEFDELGLLLPGLPVEEYNDPATFSADVIINPSHAPTVTENAYKSVNGGYKMKLGKTISADSSTTNSRQFHDLKIGVAENKKRLPSIYAAAPNEKILCNSSVTETRVLEVPLHKIPGTDKRHFALRFANIRPSNIEILNQVVVRVIGYRV